MTVIRGPKLSKDKGYSWVIVFTSFLSHFANIGFSFGTAGNLTMAHQDYFNVDLQIGSFIGTAHISVLLLFGPIASVLVKKLGCRLTEFFGSSLLLLGVGLSMLSKDLWHAIVFYSVLAGVGVSCTYTASSQILALHFDRLKYLAFSLAMLGNYVGMMVWPLLSQLLFKKFGYSQAMGIMTSSHLLHLVAGMSFFEPKESFQAGADRCEVVLSKKPKLENDENLGRENLAFDQDFIRINCGSHGKISESISDVSDVSAPNLKTDFIDLLKSWKIWLLIINGMLWNVNSAGFLILVNDYIVHNTSMDTEEAALGITILGIANIIGCVSVILTSSLSFNRFLLYFSAVAFFGVAAIAASFTSSKEMYYTMAACWGLGQSVTISSLLGVLSDMCRASQLPLLFGLQLLAEGIGGIALVPLAAYIGEASNERYGIIFVGGCRVLGVLVIFPVVIFPVVILSLQKEMKT